MAENKKIAYWAKNKKISEWSNDNKKLLRHMYNNKFIDPDDIKIMNNIDGRYKIEAQNSAFNRIKDEIQRRYSEDKLNSDKARDNYDEKLLEEYREFRKSVDKFDNKSTLLSDKIIDQIDASGIDHDVFKVLKNLLNDMSDKDTREFIHNNRKLLKDSFNDDVLEKIPDLYTQVYKAPDYGVEDTNFDKMFEDLGKKDVLDNFYKMNWRDIAATAKKKGITFEELMLQMQDAKIAKDRDDIIHGRWNNTSVPSDKKGISLDNIGNEFVGAGLTLFAPRTQEAFSMGEDPTFKDVGLDLAENVAYALPMGSMVRGAKLAGASRVGSKVGKALGGTKVGSKVGTKVKDAGSKVGNVLDNPVGRAGTYLLSNAAVPAAVEAMDAVAYDDVDNPRSDFSIADVVFGTGANIATPLATRKVGSWFKKESGYNPLAKIENWGTGKTPKEIIDIQRHQFKGVNAKAGFSSNLSKDENARANAFHNLINDNESPIGKVFNKDGTVKNPLVFDVAEQGGKNLDENIVKYFENSNKGNVIKDDIFQFMDTDGSIKKISKNDLFKKLEKNEPELASKVSKSELGFPETLTEAYINPTLIPSDTESAKGAGQLIKELIFQNYITNNIGNALYGDTESKVAMQIPFISPVNQWVKDKNAEKVRERAESKSKASDRIGERVLKEATLKKAIEDAEKNKKKGQKQMDDVKKNLRPREMTVKQLYNNIFRV